MNLSCVISCSFKFLDQIAWLKERLEKMGVEVLAPKSTTIKTQRDGFAVLEKDPDETPPGELEAAFMVKITEADFHYVFLPDYRCGFSVAGEVRWAYKNFVPSIWSCWPEEVSYVSEADEEDFTDPYFLPSGVLWPCELLVRIRKGMINKKSLRRQRINKLEFFQLFGRGWKPFVLVSGEGENEKIFRPKNPWR